ncbi:MAG: hypothetical protein NZ524_11435 [Thiobacillaceae bacterium]|nr:hypothetical protein [Thiobacillaceae bacterium]MCX7673534.1 hypothetical protein [Thiobacillaceae bacterium]MDW8324252.1 hypothetical protein [Burkholderiales bacterium]
MSADEIITLPRLRALIGLGVRYEGRTWVVVEVVEDPPGLVLEAEGGEGVMQADVHGRPWEYAHETRMIPVLSADATGLSEELLNLEILED